MRKYSNNEVGGVYKRPVYSGEDFDHSFIEGLCDAVVGVLGVFALCFALVLVLWWGETPPPPFIIRV